MSRRRAVAAALACLAAAGAAAWAVGWFWGVPGWPGRPWGATRTPQGLRSVAAVPGMLTEGLHLVGRRMGVRQWEADARRIAQPLEGKALRFEEVQDGVFYREGKAFLNFEGDGGLYEEPTGRLWLQGRFRLQHPQGYRLDARDLVWESGPQRLTTQQPVRVEAPQFTVEAGSMVLDVAAGVAHLRDGVTLHQAAGVHVRAPAADWHVETGEVVVYGSAEAWRP